MKHRTKIFTLFFIVSFIVTLAAISAPAVNAGDSVLRADPVWYWTPELTIPQHSSKAAPALAVFNGQLHMVSVGTQSKNLYHSYYDGIKWLEEERISNHMSQAGPALAVYDGKLHMVQLGSRNTDIYHSTYDGNSWTAYVQVPNHSSAETPALATYNGLLHLVYKGETSTGVYHSTYNGTSWTDQGAITGKGTQAAPALAVYDSKLHMALLGSAANDLRHSSYDGVSWSADAIIPGQTTQVAPALAECNGKLHMVHKGETTTGIYHSSYDGVSWTAHGTLPNQASQTTPAIASFNGPMRILHLGGSSNDIYESLYLGQVCLVPSYQPDFWNYYSDIQRSNNCYNYSNNKRTDTFAQPGKASGQMYTALTCAAVEPGAVADGIAKLEGTDCPSGETKIALVVAPDFDYHWYRQDSNGLWTHKPGGTAATNLDNSGEIITNPETADRGNYTDFCAYFCSCESDIPGISHEIIRAMMTEEAEPVKALKNGLKVTVMMFSGRANPTYRVPVSDSANKKMITDLFALVENNSYFRGETLMR